MMLFELFFGFFKVGCFAFGGAYGAIPLIRDIVLSYGWLSDEAFTYFVAVSESTPGPIMVNLATYVGSSKAGFFGALIATAGVVLPSFVIILLITAVLKTFLENIYVKETLKGIKPAVIGIVLATGLYMILKNCLFASGKLAADIYSIAVTFLLLMTFYGYRRLKKKELSPITLILISAFMGALLYPM